jgi:NAD(P)-dependent dehydrogenase (short-subunit alcohol dehydrogenase family)
MGRIGTADEVAEAIMWLMSDGAGYIVGARLPISGGR